MKSWLGCEFMYVNFPNSYFTVDGCSCQKLQNKNCLCGLRSVLKMYFQVGDLGLLG